MKRRSTLLALTLFSFLAAGFAEAVLIQTSGVWSGVTIADPATSTTSILGLGTDKVSWGEPLFNPLNDDEKSAYQFIGESYDPAALNSLLLLGTFTHFNNTIHPRSEDQLEDATLDFSLIVGGTTLPSMRLFEHNETGDTNLPTCCADIVNLPNMTQSVMFSDGMDDFLLEIMGWSADGGMTFITQLSSPEQQQNQAQLFGTLIPVSGPGPGVPEPGTLALMLVGLAGVGVSRRRRTQL